MRNGGDWRNGSTWGLTCPIATSSVSDIIWIGPRLNSYLCGI